MSTPTDKSAKTPVKKPMTPPSSSSESSENSDDNVDHLLGKVALEKKYAAKAAKNAKKRARRTLKKAALMVQQEQLSVVQQSRKRMATLVDRAKLKIPRQAPRRFDVDRYGESDDEDGSTGLVHPVTGEEIFLGVRRNVYEPAQKQKCAELFHLFGPRAALEEIKKTQGFEHVDLRTLKRWAVPELGPCKKRGPKVDMDFEQTIIDLGILKRVVDADPRNMEKPMPSLTMTRCGWHLLRPRSCRSTSPTRRCRRLWALTSGAKPSACATTCCAQRPRPSSSCPTSSA